MSPSSTSGGDRPQGGPPLAEALCAAEHLCANRGARLTPQRRAVLEQVLASERPLSAYAILDRLRDLGYKPAPPMVYRALDFLVQNGLVHKLESIHAFVGCNHPDHPHVGQFLICSHCGEVREIERPDVLECLHSAEESVGFRTERTVVELLGTCAQCSDRNASDRP